MVPADAPGQYDQILGFLYEWADLRQQLLTVEQNRIRQDLVARLKLIEKIGLKVYVPGENFFNFLLDVGHGFPIVRIVINDCELFHFLPPSTPILA